MTTIDRRTFLAAALAAHAAAPGDSRLPIIVPHQHLWDLKKFRLGWIKKGDPLDHSFLPADYALASKGLGIVGAVYLEVDVDPRQQQAEADWVVSLCKKGDTATRAAVVIPSLISLRHATSSEM